MRILNEGERKGWKLLYYLSLRERTLEGKNQQSVQQVCGWGPASGLQFTSGSHKGGESCRGDKSKDLCLWKKRNIAKDAYMAERVHIRSSGPEESHGRGGLARVVAAMGGVGIVMAVLCLASLDLCHLQLAVYTSSQGFLGWWD